MINRVKGYLDGIWEKGFSYLVYNNRWLKLLESKHVEVNSGSSFLKKFKFELAYGRLTMTINLQSRSNEIKIYIELEIEQIVFAK